MVRVCEEEGRRGLAKKVVRCTDISKQTDRGEDRKPCGTICLIGPTSKTIPTTPDVNFSGMYFTRIIESLLWCYAVHRQAMKRSNRLSSKCEL